MRPLAPALLILLFTLLGLVAGCDLFGDSGTGEANVAWTIPTALNHLDLTQPVVEDGLTYAVYDHFLKAVNAHDGQVLWSIDLGNGSHRISSRKLLEDGGPGGRLFLEHTDWVKAFDKETGRLLWLADLVGFPIKDLTKMVQDQDYLYLSGRGAALQVRKADGAITHRFDLQSRAPAGIIQPAYDLGVSDDGLLYIPTGYSVPGDSITIRGNVYCFDTATGDERWVFEVPNRRWVRPGTPDTVWADVGASGAVVDGDRVIITTTSQVIALDRFSGEVLWERFMPLESGFWVGPTGANGAIYAGGISRYVYKIDAATGETRWRVQVEGSLTPILVVRDGRVYFTDTAWGELWVLDDATGEPVWHGQPPGHDETGEGYISPVGVGDRYMVSVAEANVYGLTKP